MRAFIALRPPADVLLALDNWCDTLRVRWDVGAVRWVPGEHRHLTLRFLGESKAETVQSLRETLAQVAAQTAAFALRIEGVGCFPNARRPSVLWAGLGGATDELGVLQQRVEQVVRGAGWSAEERSFRPHITLGRVRSRSSVPSVNWMSEGPSLAFDARAIELVESRLGRRGPAYETLSRAPFGL